MPASAACRPRSAASWRPRARARWAPRLGFRASRRRRWSRCCGMSGAPMPPEPDAPAGAGAAAFQAATGVSRETVARLERYAAALARWQRAINLVGRATLDEVWQRHFLDSAQLIALLPDTAGPLVDLGSGAGFPGLVLAILGVPDV